MRLKTKVRKSALAVDRLIHCPQDGSVPRVQDLDMSIQAEQS